MHSQTHARKLPATRTRAHKVWWKCYLSISQLNVLISLVAHGCLGKQQSQLQKAESIHLAGCQRRRQRAGLAPLPAPCGGVISLPHSDSQQMPIHTFSLVRRSTFSNFSVILLFVLVDVVCCCWRAGWWFSGDCSCFISCIFRTVFFDWIKARFPKCCTIVICRFFH